MFALAEPKDLVIVCGEFTTGVEILETTTEPEQVLRISKIINHPRYQPNRVNPHTCISHQLLWDCRAGWAREDLWRVTTCLFTKSRLSRTSS